MIQIRRNQNKINFLLFKKNLHSSELIIQFYDITYHLDKLMPKLVKEFWNCPQNITTKDLQTISIK